jgi:spermidine synthase
VSLDKRKDGSVWMHEKLHEGVESVYRIEETLFDSNTPHQRLVVGRTKAFGNVVWLDGVTQVTERDEFCYHEMLAHVPVLAHGQVRSVLIIGGGDGGMAEEVLKHSSIERVVMVEIDPGVIDFARQHLATINKGCFDDARFELVIADGKDFAASSQDSFDVIIVDSTDPIGPGEVLFTRSFYADCKNLLNEGGVLVTQNGVTWFQEEELFNTVFNFAQLFNDAGCYLTVVPTYTGGFMALGWGTDNPDLRDVSVETLQQRYEDAGLDCRYYTPAVHKAAFALPGFIQRTVDGAIEAAAAAA